MATSPAAAAAPPTAPAPSEEVISRQQPASRAGGGRSAVVVIAVILVLLAAGATATVVAWKSGALARAWAAVTGGSGPEQVATTTGAPATGSTEETATAPSGTGEPGTTQALREVHDESGAPTKFADQTGSGERQSEAGAAAGDSNTIPASREVAAGSGTSDTTRAGGSVVSADAAHAASAPASSRRAAAARAVPPPPPSGVAVIAYGEPLFAGEGEQYLESRFAKAGVKLVDEKTLPGMMDLMEGDHVPTTDVLRRLSDVAGRVVLLRVEYLGDRPLRYMGRSEPAYQSRLTLLCVDPATGKALAPSWTEKVEYTRVQTSRAAEKSLRGPASDLVKLLEKKQR